MIAAIKAYAADILAALLIVTIVACGVQTWRLHSAQSARDAALTQIQAMEAAGRAAQAEQAAISAQREAKIQKVTNDAQAQIQAAQADATAAAGAADSLRKQLALYRASHTSSDPGVAGSGQSVEGTDPLDLLSGLFAGADDAAGKMASYADELRVRGLACERVYDALGN